MRALLFGVLCGAACTACAVAEGVDVAAIQHADDLGVIAPGWASELIARVDDQSYAGWDVEIGDANNDGVPDVLTGTAPDSRLLMSTRAAGQWRTATIANNLARAHGPGLVLGVKVVDLNGDGENEVVFGTGEENGTTARLGIAHTDGAALTAFTDVRAPENASSYTHGLATADLDGDGALEIVSAYCNKGEVIRYDPDPVRPADEPIASAKVLDVSGSGEDAELADLDGDGRLELVVSNGFRAGAAKVEIYAIGDDGRVRGEPGVVLDGYGTRPQFYASLAIGDLDGDGRPELVVGWKAEQTVNRTTLVAYHVDMAGDTPHANLAYILADDDRDFDLGYFEKMAAFVDVDGDGHTELVVSTRGDGASEGIASAHLGRIYAFSVRGTPTYPEIRKQLVADFDPQFVESSWLAAGDVDGDGVPDLVVATGRGDRRIRGVSWLLRLWRTAPLAP